MTAAARLALRAPLWHNGRSRMSQSHRTTDRITAAGAYAGYASYASLWRASAWRFT